MYKLHSCFSISLLSNYVSPLVKEQARNLEDMQRGLSLELILTSEQYKDQGNHHQLNILNLVIWFGSYIEILALFSQTQFNTFKVAFTFQDS